MNNKKISKNELRQVIRESIDDELAMMEQRDSSPFGQILHKIGDICEDELIDCGEAINHFRRVFCLNGNKNQCIENVKYCLENYDLITFDENNNLDYENSNSQELCELFNDLIQDSKQLNDNEKETLSEKAVSKSQQRFFGMVDAYKKGDLSKKDVSKSVRDAADDMTMKQVKDFAKTKHKGLPNHVKKENINELNFNPRKDDGNLPYYNEKNDIEKFEKTSPDKPIDFSKKQKRIKLTEQKLRKIIKECVTKILTKNNF